MSAHLSGTRNQVYSRARSVRTRLWCMHMIFLSQINLLFLEYYIPLLSILLVIAFPTIKKWSELVLYIHLIKLKNKYSNKWLYFEKKNGSIKIG